MYDLLKQIGQDMMEPVRYLPLGLLAGIIFFVFWRVLKGKFWKQGSSPKCWTGFLMVVYITVLLNLTLFSREPGSRNGLDLQLFETLSGTALSQAFFIENIMLFIPFGILFPMGFSGFRKGWKCILAGCLVSVCLEGIQLITGRGFCQLDDVVTNTAGTVVGWGIYCLWRGGWRHAEQNV